jgi:hypothetical protein
VHYAPLPAVIDRGGLAGPRLTTLIAYLKGVCHASYSTIRTFVRDVVKVTISRSELCSIVTKVAEALAQGNRVQLSLNYRGGLALVKWTGLRFSGLSPGPRRSL